MTLADQAAIAGHDGQVTSGKPERPKSRTFTREFKAKIVAEFGTPISRERDHPPMMMAVSGKAAPITCYCAQPRTRPPATQADHNGGYGAKTGVARIALLHSRHG